MQDYWIGIVLGAFLGVLIGMAITIACILDEITIAHSSMNSIEECQQDLPRNLQCVLIAVPENEADE